MSTKFSPRPILKSTRSSSINRPSPLNQHHIDPLLSATLKVQFSPAFLSPHVHFPPTPVLTSTITACSPKSGDRTSFIFSPSKEKYADAQYLVFQPSAKLPADVPSPTSDYPKGSINNNNSSSDSSSPSDSDDYATVITSMHRINAKVPNSPIPRARSQQEIEKALSFLPCPLSPFPRSPKLKSAPAARPSFFKSAFRRDKRSSSPLAPVSGGGGGDATNTQPNFTKPKRSPRPAALIVPATSPYNVPRFVPPGLWPQTALSPVVESPPPTPAVTLECPSSDEASDATTSTLRSAFWRSVSMQQSGSDDSDNEIARGSQDSLPTSVALISPPVLSPELLLSPSAVPSPDLLSPPPQSPYPIFLFGKKKEKGLWSPGLPRIKTKTSFLAEQQVMSPHPYSPATTASAARTFESMTSPTPFDNSSSFPSIAAALEFLGAPGMITFPIMTESLPIVG